MLREELIEFPQLSHQTFQHSLDRDAGSILKGIDKFKSIIGTINAYFEHAQHYHNSSSCVRVSQTQYPSLYRAYTKMARVLDVPTLPDLYIETIDEINAFASGIDRYSININSGLLDILSEREALAIIGHELGHVKCDHMFYNTFTYFLRYLRFLTDEHNSGSLQQCPRHQRATGSAGMEPSGRILRRSGGSAHHPGRRCCQRSLEQNRGLLENLKRSRQCRSY